MKSIHLYLSKEIGIRSTLLLTLAFVTFEFYRTCPRMVDHGDGLAPLEPFLSYNSNRTTTTQHNTTHLGNNKGRDDAKSHSTVTNGVTG